MGLYLYFWVWVFVCVWVYVSNVKGIFDKTHELRHHHLRQQHRWPSISIVFFLVWFFVGLGLGQFTDWVFLCDIRILWFFIWVWNGVWVWLFANFWVFFYLAFVSKMVIGDFVSVCIWIFAWLIIWDDFWGFHVLEFV